MKANSPYFTARKVVIGDTSDTEPFEGQIGKTVVLHYDEAPALLLESGVNVIVEGTPKAEGGGGLAEIQDDGTYSYGYTTFLKQLEADGFGKADEWMEFESGAGNRERLSSVAIVWKPGEQLDDFFCLKGSYALAVRKAGEPLRSDVDPNGLEFRPMTASGNVQVFETPSSWDISDVDGLTVGLETDSIQARIRFFDEESLAGFDYDNDSDNSDGDDQEESYNSSVEYLKNRLFTDTINDDVINQWSIRAAFGFGNDEQLKTIEFLEDGTGQTTGIKVTVKSGKTESRTFLSVRTKEVNLPPPAGGGSGGGGAAPAGGDAGVAGDTTAAGASGASAPPLGGDTGGGGADEVFGKDLPTTDTPHYFCKGCDTFIAQIPADAICQIGGEDDPCDECDICLYGEKCPACGIGEVIESFSQPAPGLHTCDNCETSWREDDLSEIEKLSMRLTPGGIVPSGQCPDNTCGALCYPADDADNGITQLKAAA